MKQKARLIFSLPVALLILLSFCFFVNAAETEDGSGYDKAPNQSYCENAGDLDGDGKIDSADAREVLRVSVGIEDISDEQIKFADVDNDGKVQASDARDILRYSVGLENGFSHIKGESIVLEDATCFTLGSSADVCALCGKLYNYGKIPKTDHMGGGWDTVEEATCEVEGLAELRCVYCNAVMDTKLTEKANHDFGETRYETAPSCFDYVNTYRVCKVCGFKEYTTEAPTGKHSYYWKTEKEATCTEDGLAVETCAHCNAKSGREQVIENTGGHKYGKARTEKNATCTEDGLKIYTCRKCSETKEEIIPATGHNVQDGTYKVTKTANCTEKGEAEYYCTNCCQTVKEELPALGHTPVGEPKVTPAKCTEQGSEEYYCSRCKTNVKITLAAKGHTPGEWEYAEIEGRSVFVSEETLPLPAEYDEAEGKRIVFIRRCKDCGEIVAIREYD